MSDDQIRRVGGSSIESDQSDGVPVDPTLAAPQPGEVPSQLENVFEAFEKALAADVTFEPITLEVAKRPGVAVRYSTVISNEQISAWRKRAEDRSKPDNFNNLRFAAAVVANQCVALTMGGKDVTDSVGQLMTFAHAQTKAMAGLTRDQSSSECAIKVIGADPHVMSHCNAVLIAAGFADDAIAIDGEGPTNAS